MQERDDQGTKDDHVPAHGVEDLRARIPFIIKNLFSIFRTHQLTSTLKRASILYFFVQKNNHLVPGLLRQFDLEARRRLGLAGLRV